MTFFLAVLYSILFAILDLRYRLRSRWPRKGRIIECANSNAFIYIGGPHSWGFSYFWRKINGERGIRSVLPAAVTAFAEQMHRQPLHRRSLIFYSVRSFPARLASSCSPCGSLDVSLGRIAREARDNVAARSCACHDICGANIAPVASLSARHLRPKPCAQLCPAHLARLLLRSNRCELQLSQRFAASQPLGALPPHFALRAKCPFNRCAVSGLLAILGLRPIALGATAPRPPSTPLAGAASRTRSRGYQWNCGLQSDFYFYNAFLNLLRL